MPHWIFSFTNPFSLLLYFLIVELIIKIVAVVQHTRWSQSIKGRLLVYAILILISVIVHHRMLFTDDSRKSPVNIWMSYPLLSYITLSIPAFSSLESSGAEFLKILLPLLQKYRRFYHE